MATNLKLTGIAYHRNGVHGQPFFAVTFDWRRGRKVQHMVATVFAEEDAVNGGFDDDGRIAILDATMASHGDVRFGINSWRYEDFAFEIKGWIKNFDIMIGRHPLLAATQAVAALA